jgi:hypothetical protein
MAIINTSMQNIKNFFRESWLDQLISYFVVVCMIMIAFSLGALYEREALKRAYPTVLQEDPVVVKAWEEYLKYRDENAHYVASKSGTKVYPINCKAGERIKEENRVYFLSVEQAEGFGYEPTSRC